MTSHRKINISRLVVKYFLHTDRFTFLRGHGAFWECMERLLYSGRNGLTSTASWGKRGASALWSFTEIHVAMAAYSPFHWACCAGSKHRRRQVNAEGFRRARCNRPSRHFTGSKDHRKTDSDGKADWKRSLWRSLDGKVARRKGSRESVFYHRGGQLVQRNRNLPDCPDEAWKYSWWVKLKRIIW